MTRFGRVAMFKKFFLLAVLTAVLASPLYLYWPDRARPTRDLRSFPPDGGDLRAEIPTGAPIAGVAKSEPQRTIVHGYDGVELPADRFPGELPVFEERLVGDYIGGEPMIVFAPDGTAFYDPLGLPAHIPGRFDRPITGWVVRSRDDAHTWEVVTPPPRQLDDADFLMTDDPYIHVDPYSGRVFDVQWIGTHALRVPDLNGPIPPKTACLDIAWSDDNGATWTQRDFLCPGYDHQTLFNGPPAPGANFPSTTYMYDNYVGMRRSLDGGATWGEGTPLFSTCGPDVGHGNASPVDGTVYIPRVTCELPNTTEEAAIAEAEVAVSRDYGQTWEVVVVDNQTITSHYAHEARVWTDAGGNAYFFYHGKQGVPYLSISRDRGRTWSTPRNVGVPGLTAVNDNFPVVIAGDVGKVAFSYIGTTSPDPTADSATWNQYVGMSLNALDAEPVFVTTTTNELAHPVKRGWCYGRCPPGKNVRDPTGPNGDGYLSGVTEFRMGMMDFLNMTVHPKTHMLWTSMVDDCTGACDEHGGTLLQESNHAAVGVQIAGASIGSNMSGPVVAPPAAGPATGVTAAADARFGGTWEVGTLVVMGIGGLRRRSPSAV